MCLAVKYNRASGRKTGYKILRKQDGDYFSGMCGASTVKINRHPLEYTEDPNKANIIYCLYSDENYRSGFHIFANLEEARKIWHYLGTNLAICKVAFKDEVAFGEVHWSLHIIAATIIAQKCKVISEVSGQGIIRKILNLCIGKN